MNPFQEKENKLNIRLISVNANHAEFFYQLMNSNKWIKYIGDRKINSIKAAEDYIRAKMSPHLEEIGFVNHIIQDSASGHFVGTCSLHKRDGIPGIDIGYALLPEYEGKGYATVGAIAMINLAFEHYEQDEVFAITTDDNTGSCRLLEKLGFEKGTLIRLHKDSEELRLYSLKKEVYEEN